MFTHLEKIFTNLPQYLQIRNTIYWTSYEVHVKNAGLNKYQNLRKANINK